MYTKYTFCKFSTTCFHLAAEISIDEAACAIFPTFQSVDTALYRMRRKNYPTLPQTLGDIIFPPNLLRTISGENFLLHSAIDNAILIFSAPSNLQRYVCFALCVSFVFDEYVDANLTDYLPVSIGLWMERLA